MLLGLALVVKAPSGTQFLIGEKIISAEEKKGAYTLFLPQPLAFPLVIKATGPFGGIVARQFDSPSQIHPYEVEAGIIKDSDSNPAVLAMLPALCPRLKKEKESYLYEASEDVINHLPSLQMIDPDIKKGKQEKIYPEIDGKNVLLMQKITVRHDYEDEAGGFYANFHYAIIPYSSKILSLEPQRLLHLVQGRLKEIDAEETRPEIRVHSLLPGPFLSHSDNGYTMCEWGDTAHQAPEQTLAYRELVIWDWDLKVKNASHILMVVWEGDEENGTHITDDLVGIFEIKKKQTKKPLTLKNPRGDFEITLETQ